MHRRNNGFTLIELLLVIAILGILASIGLSTYTAALIKGHDARRKSDLSQIAKALELYKNDFGEYPADDGNGGMIGCEVSGGSLSKCPLTTNGPFEAVKNNNEIVYLEVMPVEFDSSREYYYQQTGSGTDIGFALYAALENTNDIDAKIDPSTGDPDPNGWGIYCGSGGGTPYCNYKLTNYGVVRQ